MALPDQPTRQYIAEAQLIVSAPDPATAQQSLEAAVGAFKAGATGIDPPVTLLVEESEGQIVLAEQ